MSQAQKDEARNKSVFDFHLYVCIFYKIPTEINISYGKWEWEMGQEAGGAGEEELLIII